MTTRGWAGRRPAQPRHPLPAGPGYAARVSPPSAPGMGHDRYEERVAQARTALRAGDRGAALERLRTASVLWRGPILPDVPCPVLHTTEVYPLTERCLDTCEQRYELELDDGRDADAVEELT